MRARTWLSTALVGLALALPGLSRGQGTEAQPVVAVFQIENKGADIDGRTLERLSDYLTLTLASTSSYQVIPRAQLTKRLRELKKDSLRQCYDEACQIEIGRELAAQKSLATQIIKLGSQCVVTTILYDLRKSASEGGAQAEGGCSEDDLVRSLKQIISTLEGKTARTAHAGQDPEQSRTVSVNVTTNPERAYLFMDGRGLGWTPLKATMVRGQSHIVVLQKRGYQPLRKHVVAQKSGKLHLDLKPATGYAQPGQSAIFQSLYHRQQEIEARKRQNLKTGSEIFAMSPIVAGNVRGALGGLSLQFFSLTWDHVYWTIFDLGFGFGSNSYLVHLETVLGMPFYLGATGQHHLKTGLGMALTRVGGFDDVDIGISSEDSTFFGMTLVPAIDYFYRTRGRTFLGVGLRFLVPSVASDDDTSGDYAFTFLIRFTVGWSRY